MLPKILNFAFCPHCLEKDIEEWKSIISYISSILERQINIVTFEDFIEEEKKLQEFDYHFVYANPDSTIKLIQKGYILLGKLKNENHSICSIISSSYYPQKEIINVALINRKFSFLPLLFHKKVYKNFQLLFTRNYDEILELVQSSAADIGFIYTKTLEELKNGKNIKISEDFCFPCPHFIFIHPSLEKYKDALLNIEDIEKASEDEIEHIKSLYSQLDLLLEQWANNDIVEALKSSPIIGIIVYQEKIVFINEYALNILGYREDEILEMSSTDLVYSKDREKVIENMEKRLRGEKFSAIYEISFIKKDGKIIPVQCLASTILFRGRCSNFILFYDISRQKCAENIKEILKQINKTITTSLTEEEIFSGICKALVDNFKFKLVWIGICDESCRRIPKFHFGEDQGIIEFFEKTEHICEKALNEKNVIVNPDLRINGEDNPLRAELLKRGILSSCLIPILKHDRVVAILSIYSEFPDYFNESIIDLLREIQRDLSFAVERVERIRQNMIIAEALKHSDTWILVTDEKGDIIYVNEAVEKISGYTKEELLGKNPRIFKSGLNPPEFYKQMWNTILSGKIFNAITPNRKKNGEIFHADLKIVPVSLPGNILRFVAVAKDITEKIMLSERINILQNYDALTGLLNLNGFAAQVPLKLKETKDRGIIGVLILIDVFNMTSINKTLGISGGDGLLKFLSQKLKETFKETDAIARISADTFGIYLTLEGSYELSKTYSRLFELNDLSFQIDNKSILFYINAGLAFFPKDGETFKTLYEKADITLPKAKKEGPGIIKFFDPGIEKEIETQWNVINLVKKAFEQDLFVLYYQPYYHTDTLEVAGFEALVRIVQGDKIYYPGFFMDYIENSQYLSKFEDWLIKEATEKIKKWNINISINISGKTFNEPDFIKKLSWIDENIRDKITVEITERIFIENPERTIELISMIKKLKNPPKIAIDDFGTGYSSLVYLKDLAVDIIKIDIAFVRDMLKDKKSFVIVQTIIELAKRLDYITLAEGVEDKQHLDILRVLGCDMLQGFFLSKPLSEKAVESDIIK
jgi:PAS domain S-box-containing protein/diguanylate cyclase (GGDEF)-like protein